MRAPSQAMRLCAITFAVAAVGLTGCEPDPGQGPAPDPDTADEGGAIPKLYQADTVLKLDLSAPFTLINQFGSFDEFDGVLGVNGKKIAVKVTSRGNTSRFECSFRKLEVSIVDEASTMGTAFDGVGSFKIGTHCAPQSLVIGEELEEGSLTQLGRLVSDVAPLRERFLYEIYEQLTPFSHLTRRASIRYHDTAPGASTKAITRPAFLLERFKHVRKRHGGVELAPEQVATHDDVDADHLALDFLYQILILNTDWQVGDLVLTGKAETGEGGLEGPRNLWNHHAMELPETAGKPGLRIPVPNDFDIAQLGTVWPDRVLPPGQEQFEIEDFEAEYARRLAFFRKQFPAKQEAFAVDRVIAARDAIAARLDAAGLDPEGAAIIAEAIDAFYAALDAN